MTSYRQQTPKERVGRLVGPARLTVSMTAHRRGVGKDGHGDEFAPDGEMKWAFSDSKTLLCARR